MNIEGRGEKQAFFRKWIVTYKDMPVTVRASMLFTIAGILQKGISIIVVPIYTRLMPTGDYGQYSVFFSWYQLLMIFTTLNMWNYLINNGMTEFKDRRDDFIASLQGLAGIITLAWIAIYIPLSGVWENLTGLTVPMMVFMFAELLIMPSYEYWCSVKRYDYQATGVVLTSILITVLTPVVAIPLIMFSEQKGFMAIATKSGVSIAIYAVVMFIMLRNNRKLYNKEFWVYALKFNLPLIPHFLSIMLLQSSDRIMIERMCGTSDAALYTVAYQAALALSIFNAAVLNTFIPYTYRAIKDGHEANIGKRAIPLVVFIGLINFAFALFAPEVIAILAPEKYYDAIYVIPPVAMSNLLMFLFNLFANIEYYYKETKLVAVASVLSAVTNVALNYVFIQRYGFIAAGYTTVVCYVLFSICHYIFMRRVAKKHMSGKKIYDAKKLLFIVGGFVIAAVAITAFYDAKYILIRYGMLAVLMILAWWKKGYIVQSVKG